MHNPQPTIKMDDEKIYTIYFSLQKIHAQEYGCDNTVVFLQIGSFYEMYTLQDCAPPMEIIKPSCEDGYPPFEKVCAIAELSKSAKKTVVYFNNKKHNVLMAGFPDSTVDKYLRILTETGGFTIALYNQHKNSAGVVSSRPLLGIFSPSTYVVSDTATASITRRNNVISCIWFELINLKSSVMFSNSAEKSCGATHKMYVGMSSLNISTGSPTVHEFSNLYNPRDTFLFDQLNNFLTIHDPVELIVVGNMNELDMQNILNTAHTSNIKKFHIISTIDNDTEIITPQVKRAKNCEKQTYQNQILSKYYSRDCYEMTYMREHVFANQSFCYLLDFVHVHNSDLIKQIDVPSFDIVGDSMLLENSSLLQLNILDDGNQIQRKFSSVLKMCCSEVKTEMGKRKIGSMLLHPTSNVEQLNREYAILTHVKQNYQDETIQTIQTNLNGICDMEQYWRFTFSRKLNPNHLYLFHNGLVMVNKMCDLISDDLILCNYVRSVLGKNTTEISSHAKQIINYIETVIDISNCKGVDCAVGNVGNFMNVLKKENNASLYRCMVDLYSSKDQLEAYRTFFENLLSPTNISTLKRKTKNGVGCEAEDEDDEEDDGHDLFGTNKGRTIRVKCTKQSNIYSLTATETRCKQLAIQLKELHTKNTNGTSATNALLSSTVLVQGSDGTYQLKIGNETRSWDDSDKTYPVIDFLKITSRSKDCTIRSTQISECTEKLTKAKLDMSAVAKDAYLDVLKELEKHNDEIHIIIQFISTIDALFARVVMAQKNGYCCPIIMEPTNTINDNPISFVNAQNLRHCIIEKIQTSTVYVPNSIALNGEGMLLYGINAVGKTSLMKSLGIAIILAQGGFFVPATRFQYYPYTKLFTRIIGNDNMAKSLSTFEVEMLELNAIVKGADCRSIVLGDELCKGTESASAMAIIMATLERLCKRKVSFIVATHYHEVARRKEVSDLSNLFIKHMELIYDSANDQVVYDRTLKDGSGSNHYGLEVCRALKMPSDFIDIANNYRIQYDHESGAGSVLEQKTSTYNSQHVRGMCQKCGKTMSTEVHHIKPQQLADKHGFIHDEKTGTIMHKNHPANLMSVCEKCHLSFHH